MFDFQKLEVYNKSKTFVKETALLQATKNFDRVIQDQLRRASTSIMLNIAEGSSRFSNKDRRNFMIIARGSAFECVAILDLLQDEKIISAEVFQRLYLQLEEVSKMLWGLIRKLEKE
jgi:four helix bundle protein